MSLGVARDPEFPRLMCYPPYRETDSPTQDLIKYGVETWKGEDAIIYCNGIESTPEQALAQAKIISDAFARRVFIVYNPTKVSGFFKLGTIQQAERVATVANDLARQIKSGLEIDPLIDVESRKKEEIFRPRVHVFAHIHCA